MPDTDELRCREVVQLVPDYLDGHLLPADRRRFAAHLAACPGCVAYVAQMRATVALLGAVRIWPPGSGAG